MVTKVDSQQRQRNECNRLAATADESTSLRIDVDLSLWPPQLHSDVKQHGAPAVWAAGIEANGFPPTWIHTGKEIMAVRRILNETN